LAFLDKSQPGLVNVKMSDSSNSLAEKIKVDLYKRALDLGKATLQQAESAIRTVEEKGRNNSTAAPTIVGFAALILRPDVVLVGFKFGLSFQETALLCFGLAVLSVILNYIFFLTIVRPAQADLVDAEWIATLPKSVTTELESVASELGVAKIYIEQSQSALKQKSRALEQQTRMMLLTVVMILLYLVFGAIHLSNLANVSTSNQLPTLPTLPIVTPIR
jgi:hypothetical protein